MTALTATPGRIDAPWGVGDAARPSRSRHLVSVPTGAGVPERAEAGLHITRRGRLAMTTTALLVASIAGAALAFGGPAAAPQEFTVESGQTLSQIAESELAGMPATQAVAAIQTANDLPTRHVHAGQTLVIPAP